MIRLARIHRFVTVIAALSPLAAVPAAPAGVPDSPGPPAATAAAGEPQPFIVVRTPDGEDVVWLERQTARRAYIGLRLTELTPELREHFGAPRDRGLLVGRIVPDSPAAAAGLSVGDLLLALDGRPMASLAEVRALLFTRSPGDETEITYLRDGAETTVRVPLGSTERSQVDLSLLARLPGEVSIRRLVDEMRELSGDRWPGKVEIAPIAIDEERLEQVIAQLRRHAEAGVAAAARIAASAGAEAGSDAARQARERQRELLERRLRALERKIEELERRLRR